MTVQTVDPQYFPQMAWRIRAQVATILTRWGLLPRFKRWRLTQDPDTGMRVLFGVLNNSYIATHTSIPLGDYFDRRVLHDLANELQVQVVSCNSDGLRYAFILDRGQLGKLPTHIDFPFIENGKLLARVVYSDTPPTMPVPPLGTAMIDDHSLVRQGVGAFLKIFDDINLRKDAALQRSAQEVPAIVVIDEDEFNLSLENGRSVIALSRSGRLADELTSEPARDNLSTAIPANAEQRIVEATQAVVSITEQASVTELNLQEEVISPP